MVSSTKITLQLIRDSSAFVSAPHIAPIAAAALKILEMVEVNTPILAIRHAVVSLVPLSRVLRQIKSTVEICETDWRI